MAAKLEQAGLKDKEAAVYTAVLELGGGYPSKIAEYAKLNRSTAYKILTDLAVKGLVNEVEKRNKIYYQAERPLKLLRYAEGRARRAEDAIRKTRELLPEIEGLFSLSPQKPRIRFFEGYPEVLGVHEDHLLTNEKYEMLAWANGKAIAAFLPDVFRRKYLKKKMRLGIATRAIVPDTSQDRAYNKNVYGSALRNIWPELRFVPAEKFFYPCEITIYEKNKISILNFNKKNPVGVIIEDQTIHDMLVIIFELSWKSASLKS